MERGCEGEGGLGEKGEEGVWGALGWEEPDLGEFSGREGLGQGRGGGIEGIWGYWEEFGV